MHAFLFHFVYMRALCCAVMLRAKMANGAIVLRFDSLEEIFSKHFQPASYQMFISIVHKQLQMQRCACSVALKYVWVCKYVLHATIFVIAAMVLLLPLPFDVAIVFVAFVIVIFYVCVCGCVC